jgi:predicted transcriptional regulator
MSEYELYNGTPPHQAESDTSRAAAESVEVDAETLRGRVWQCLRRKDSYGATDVEIQQALGMSVSTEVPRRRELVMVGAVRDSGLRRRTHTGRFATVWVAVDGPPTSDRQRRVNWRILYEEAMRSLARVESELAELKRKAYITANL